MPLRIAWICLLVALGEAAGLPLDTVDFVCDTTAFVAIAVPARSRAYCKPSPRSSSLAFGVGLFLPISEPDVRMPLEKHEGAY